MVTAPRFGAGGGEEAFDPELVSRLRDRLTPTLA